MKQLIIKPRRSGKTYYLLDHLQASSHYGNAFLICPNFKMCQNVRELMHEEQKRLYSGNIVTADEFLYKIAIKCIKNPDVILIDEYFFIQKDKREELTKYLINNNCNFIATGTSDKLYDPWSLEQIKYWRPRKNNRGPNGKSTLKNESEMIDEYGSEYFYNLLSYPEVEVTTNFGKAGYIMSEEQYKTEILGEYLK